MTTDIPPYDASFGEPGSPDEKERRRVFLLKCYTVFRAVERPDVFMNDVMIEQLNYKYWIQVEKIKAHMLASSRRIDVHKIIATTELVIMQYLMIRRNAKEAWAENAKDDAGICEVNADFAIHVARSMMSEWYPDLDLTPIKNTDGFIEAHKNWLMNYADSTGSYFPVFALSLQWYLVDCLCHKRIR
jgi:hypothetical protein